MAEAISTIAQAVSTQGHSAAFLSALQEFKAGLSDDDVNECKAFSTLANLQSAIKDIEADQANRGSIRNMTRIRPLLEGLQCYSGVIEVFVNAKPDMLAFIWGPIKLCLQIATSFTRAFDALLDAYQKLGNTMPIFSAIEDSFTSNPLVQGTLVQVYRDILAFHSRALRFFRKKGWQIALKLTFRTFDGLFGEVLENLEKSRELLFISTDVAHLQETKKSFQEIHQAQEERRQEFQNQQAADEKERIFVVLDWLQPTNQTNRQDDLDNQREEFQGTTEWIFNHQNYQDWIQEDNDTKGIFWLSGIPGAGKTFLFSAIVNEYKRNKTTALEFGAAFFYCKYNDPMRNTYIAIARSLVSQLLQNNQNGLAYVYDVVLKSGERYANTKKIFPELLSSLTQCYNHILIGIDGLDECEPAERKQTITLLRSLLDSSEHGSKLKVLISSCAEKDIERSIGVCKSLRLKAQDLSVAIESYVRTRLVELNRIFKFSTARLEHIMLQISNESAGMFLLARLILDNLQGTGSREDVEEELATETLPQGINQAYERILARIRTTKPVKNQQRAKLVLEALVSARRPPKVHEVQAILSIRLDDKSIDLESRRYLHHLKDLCGPIIDVAVDGTVELVHSTAKKYLDENHSAFLDTTSAAGKLTELSVSYLSFDCFASTLAEPDLTTAMRRGDYALQDYAVCNWIPHILDLRQRAGSTEILLERLSQLWKQGLSHRYSNPPDKEGAGSDPIWEESWKHLDELQEKCCNYACDDVHQSYIPQILETILKTRSTIETAFETMQAPSELDLLKEAYGHFCFKCPTFACPEYQQGFSSRQERDTHTQKHIRKYKCPSEECDFHRIGFISQKTLDAHVLYFHETITLAYRFPVLKPQSGPELLVEAIDQDDPDLVQSLLLQIKDVPNAQELLERAVKRGSQNSACVLLSFAQFDTIQLKEMLRLTMIGGQSKITSTILSILSDQEIQAFLDGLNVTKALTSLASSNDLNNLRTIIAKLNAGKPQQWHDVLDVALSSNLHDIRSLILDNAAKLHIGRRALRSSAEKLAKKGDRDSVRLLLSQSFQLKSSYIRYSSKGLKAASAQEIDTMVDLVMGRASNPVNAEGKTFGNALQKEALAGNDERVTELLDSGADIENSNSSYGTALAAAARKGNISTMKVLLQRGANPKTSIPRYFRTNSRQYKKGYSAIDIAADEGSLAAVQLLLENGADVGSALLLTAQSDNLDLARELIKAGADPSAYCSQQGWTPLHGAAYGVQKDMALLLLDNGASIHAVTEPCKESALHLAIHPGYYSYYLSQIDQYHEKAKRRLALVRSLLDRGADVMAKDSKGNTPLHTFFASGFEMPNAEVLDTTLAMLQSLIERGADLKSTNDQGQTPRDMVIALAYEDRDPKKLIEIIDPKPDNENGQANERSEQQLEPQW